MSIKIITGKFVKLEVSGVTGKNARGLKNAVDRRAGKLSEKGFRFLLGGAVEKSFDKFKEQSDHEAWFYKTLKEREVKR